MEIELKLDFPDEISFEKAKGLFGNNFSEDEQENIIYNDEDCLLYDTKTVLRFSNFVIF
jgi:adenylate cyclase class IV